MSLCCVIVLHGVIEGIVLRIILIVTVTQRSITRLGYLACDTESVWYNESVRPEGSNKLLLTLKGTRTNGKESTYTNLRKLSLEKQHTVRTSMPPFT